MHHHVLSYTPSAVLRPSRELRAAVQTLYGARAAASECSAVCALKDLRPTVKVVGAPIDIEQMDCQLASRDGTLTALMRGYLGGWFTSGCRCDW